MVSRKATKNAQHTEHLWGWTTVAEQKSETADSPKTEKMKTEKTSPGISDKHRC